MIIFNAPIKVKITYERTRHDASHIYSPAYTGDAGSDISIPADYAGKWIFPFRKLEIDTGLKLQARGERGELYAILLYPRSGHWRKRGLWLHGIIDAGYTGNIIITVRNLSLFPYRLKLGEKIAQALLAPVYQVELGAGEIVEGQRGSNGFGSTG